MAKRRPERIDLTTLGGDVPLPPRDHPIFAGPIREATDISSVDLTPQMMALRIIALEGRCNALEQWVMCQTAFHISTPIEGKN